MQQRLERWKDRIALVTGATSGIGRETSLALAEIGMRVAISGRRTERLHELERQIVESGGKALSLPGDQTHPETNRAFFDTVRNAWGGVDVLINNAGATGGKSLLQDDFSTIERCFDLNLKAALLCMREATADMRVRKEGAIVNISSMTAYRVLAGRGSSAYAASKHALRVITDGLRAEIAAEKLPIKVAMISPGLVDTEFHTHSGRSFDYQPLKPEDIADAVLYILSTPPHVQICDILMRSTEQIE